MSGAQEVPICMAIVLCNDTIEDKRTNNRTLLNLFNVLTVPGLPSLNNRFCVLISVTNSSGITPYTVRVHSPSEQEIARFHVDLKSESPLATYDIVFEFSGMLIHEVGTHRIEVLSGVNYLGSRRFEVALPPQMHA